MTKQTVGKPKENRPSARRYAEWYDEFGRSIEALLTFYFAPDEAKFVMGVCYSSRHYSIIMNEMACNLSRILDSFQRQRDVVRGLQLRALFARSNKACQSLRHDLLKVLSDMGLEAE